MSTVIMSKCWPLVMSPSAKSVLISLADNANDHGHCWPSIATICRRTCLGKTAVCASLNWLETTGLIARVAAPGMHNAYWITPEAGVVDARGTPKTHPGTHPFASRTSSPREQVATRTAPVRQANDHLSASRTSPVREANTNRKEPSEEPSLNRQSGASRSRALPTDGPNVELVETQKGTRLPSGWEPEAKDAAFAELQLGSEWREHLDAFRDYWEAIPGARGRKVKWGATFRNWIRNEKRARRRSSAGDEQPSKTMRAITALLKGTPS